DHGEHAGNGQRLLRVDLHDLGVGVGAPHDVEVEHARELDVVHVGALAADEARVFLALDGMPHPSDLGRCLGRHQEPPWAIAVAACWTALTMFTYPVHRQRLPEMAWRISSSVGALCLPRKA